MARQQRNVRRLGSAAYRTDYSLPKSQWRIRRWITVALLVLGCIGLIYVLFFANVFRITGITVKGNTSTSSQAITDQVNQILNSSFTGHNILFADLGAVHKGLTQSNFQFSSVTVSRQLFHTLTITVSEHQPSLLWQSNSSLYVLSDDGRAIEQTNEQLPNSLPIIHDSANLPVKLGEAIVPEQFIGFCRNLIALMNQNSIPVKELSVPATTNELFVKTGAYTIKFDTTRSAAEQVNALTTVLKTLAKQNTKPHDYIDLRISGEVFYQ